jgi:hypothetical protein
VHELEVYRSGSESGDGGTEPVVGPWDVIPGSGDPNDPHDEVGVGIDVAAVDVDYIRFLHDCFAVLKRQLDTVIARFHFERESAGVVRHHSLAFTGIDIDDLDRPPLDCTCALGSADGPAYRAVCLERLWAEVDDRAPMTCTQTQQSDRDRDKPTSTGVVRAVEPGFSHIVPRENGLQRQGHCTH